MTRRDVLALAGSLPGFLSSTAASAQTSAGRRMGGTPAAFLAHVRAAREGGGPFDIVEHCHQMGLAGVQTNPPSMDPEAIRKFRERLESYRMHLVTDPRLPKDASEVAAFDAQVKAHKEAGAVAFHAALTGRRYDDFTAFEPWKEMFLDRQRQVQLAEPVLRKYKVPLGLENHKGYRSAEQAAWLKRLGSEWVGVCLDFGNNLSLCEDPSTRPARSRHTPSTLTSRTWRWRSTKTASCSPRFRSERGLVDLPQIIAILRKKDPNMIFNLEMITRDPLKIPVFTPKYWATFDDSYSPLPGRDLAKVLDLVHKHKPKQPLPRTAGLSVAQQLKLEDELNQKCATYAREHLAL